MRAWWAALLGVVIGCGGSPSEPVDAGADTGTPTCPASCDDGMFCNGVETCNVATGMCTHASGPCGTGTVCNEATDRCEAGGCADADGDGAMAMSCGGTDCDDTDIAIHPGAVEACDAAGVDDDCDTATLAGAADGDRDGDGYLSRLCCNGTACGDDCDDAHASISPAAGEICNDFDDDCDDATDEGVGTPYFPDCDHDGFGGCTVDTSGACVPSTATAACTVPTIAPPSCAGRPGALWAFTSTDCNDDDGMVGPGAREIFGNSVDDNCDGREDELYDVAGGIRALGGSLDGPTYQVRGGALEITSSACGATYCVTGGIQP